jgi:hypothetical protein
VLLLSAADKSSTQKDSNQLHRRPLCVARIRAIFEVHKHRLCNGAQTCGAHLPVRRPRQHCIFLTYAPEHLQ